MQALKLRRTRTRSRGATRARFRLACAQQHLNVSESSAAQQSVRRRTLNTIPAVRTLHGGFTHHMQLAMNRMSGDPLPVRFLNMSRLWLKACSGDCTWTFMRLGWRPAQAS